jgi:hypothetical protein
MSITVGIPELSTSAAGECPPVMVVLDPSDDVAVTKAVLADHDPARGRIVVDPTPGSGQPAASMLGKDLLVALGKPADQLSVQGVSGAVRGWQAAAAWIAGEDIRQVIILRGHRLGAEPWAKLLELRARTGLSLIVVYHDRAISGPGRAALAGVPHHITRDLAGVLANASLGGLHEVTGTEQDAEADAEDEDEGPLPRLPSSGVVRFRAEAWRQLSPTGFARVDACYVAGMTAARRWLAAHPDYQQRVTRRQQVADLVPDSLARRPSQDEAGAITQTDPAEALAALVDGPAYAPSAPRVRSSRWGDTDGLAVMLSALAASSPSPRHTVARLRGAEAGFLRHGLLLTLPARLTRLPGPGMGTVAFTDRFAARIRARVAHPVLAARLAVEAFTGLDHEIVRGMPPEALSVDATTLRLRIQQGARPVVACYFVPPCARGLLRAARAYHALHLGTPPSGLLSSAGGAGSAAFSAAAEACHLPAVVNFLPAEEDRAGWHEKARAFWITTPLPETRHAQRDGAGSA